MLLGLLPGLASFAGATNPGAASVVTRDGAIVQHALEFAPDPTMAPSRRTQALRTTPGFSALAPVDVTSLPNRATVWLRATFSDGTQRTGSGVLIRPEWVLTAANLIWDPVHDFAIQVHVIPARDGATGPFGSADSAAAGFAFLGWTRDRDVAWNLGWFRLSRPVGVLTGTVPLRAADDTALGSETLDNAGYPVGGAYPGDTLYGWSGGPTSVGTGLIAHDGSGVDGMPGSPLTGRGAPGAVGIFASEPGQPAQYARLTSVKVDALNNFLTATQLNAPDLTPLQVTPLTPTVEPGDYPGAVRFTLYNLGAAAFNGRLLYTLRLSNNLTFSDADTVLFTQTIDFALAARTAVERQISPAALSSTIDPGTWYLGIELFAVDDGDTTNDTVHPDDAGVLTVVAPPTGPAAPTGLSATLRPDGGVDLSWTDASADEDGFAVERQIDVGVWSELATLPAGTEAWTDTSPPAGSTISYRVRAFRND